MSEINRIADQLTRAMEKDAWHGDSLLPLLKNIKAADALAKPLENVHNIWELVLHIRGWQDAVRRRLAGTVTELSVSEDWPPIADTSEKAWKAAVERLSASYQRLRETILALNDKDLEAPATGKGYPVYIMLHGLIQHNVYHTGQIAILRKEIQAG